MIRWWLAGSAVAGSSASVALGRGGLFDIAIDSNLPAGRVPLKRQRRVWIRGQFRTLAATRIGKEQKSLLVNALAALNRTEDLPAFVVASAIVSKLGIPSFLASSSQRVTFAIGSLTSYPF